MSLSYAINVTIYRWPIRRSFVAHSCPGLLMLYRFGLLFLWEMKSNQKRKRK